MGLTTVFLDTSAYSAFRRGHRAIVNRIRHTPSLLVSPIVLGELYSGFAKGQRRAENRETLIEFLRSPRVEVVPIDEGVADRYARILDFLRRQGTPIPTNDIWIAAGAMATGASILTTDRHFERVPQVVAEILDSN